MKIASLFILLLFTFGSCSSQRKQEKIVKDFMNDGGSQDVDFYSDFKKLGKDIIPYLIEAIDSPKMGFVGFADPKSSKLQTFHYNYSGIRAAYMIEYLLSGSKEIKIYNYCVIIRYSESHDVKNPLDEIDIKKVKAIYKQWWDINCNKTLQELNEDWSRNFRPLTNQDYRWI